jgi:hypothetical protein
VAVGAAGDVSEQFGGLDAFGHLSLDALVEHYDDASYDLQVADLFRGDIDQEILAAGVDLGEALREISHGRGKFAVRTAELFEDEIGDFRVGRADAHGIHQTLVMHEQSGSLPSMVGSGCAKTR